MPPLASSSATQHHREHRPAPCDGLPSPFSLPMLEQVNKSPLGGEPWVHGTKGPTGPPGTVLPD